MIQATVMIAAWNASDTIENSVASAVAQDGLSVEVIVADDVSGDDTAARADAAGARVLRMAENGGPGAARNLALDAAAGEWVGVLDSDDTMAPDRMKRMIETAVAHKADVVLGNLMTCYPEGSPYEGAPFLRGAQYDTVRHMDFETYLREDQDIGEGRSLGFCKPVVRRAFLEEHGIRYNPDLRNGEDFHLILECFAAGAKVIFDPHPDYFYLVRSGSISYRADPAHIAALIVADQAFTKRHKPNLSQEVLGLFATRLKALKNLKNSEIILQNLKAFRPAQAIQVFLGHPSSGCRVVTQLWEALQKRFRRGSHAWKT